MDKLNLDIRNLNTIGKKRASVLNKLGIFTLYDLISYFPRAYEDRRSFRDIADLAQDSMCCIRACVISVPQVTFIRRGMELLRFRVADDTGSLYITFFNQSYLKNSIKSGKTYCFYGKVSKNSSRLEMLNPQFEPDGKSNITGRILPIYRLTSGISQNQLINYIRQGLSELPLELTDPIPDSVRRSHNIPELRYSYENIHFPRDDLSLALSRRRFIFEEFFTLAAALRFFRVRSDETSEFLISSERLSEFIGVLPFPLTNAQLRSINEMTRDMSSGKPMNRLLQGDVGSGKTIVAAASAYLSFCSGYQSAFMAPTEILAQQHFQTLSNLLEPFGMHIALLTSSTHAKQKREIYSALLDGSCHLVVGTHAILSDIVRFRRLALVITDEQHRFGVQQRAALSQKGNRPHVLVMSATPIPRTLALMIYGDLDISILDELPPGRQKVDTFVVGENMRKRVQSFIRKLVGEGRQVYIVCPMVEENETLNLKAAETYASDLQKNTFPDLRIECIHGRLKSKQKDSIMEAFARGEIDILVSTTVIEVGLDVPNAALMIVENAERFGLSQLHQLRGRVGRGAHKSYCILFTKSGNATERLKVMTETNDGFKISEEDLKLRGPGDFFGHRQHGLPELKIADISCDIQSLYEAQNAANQLLDMDPFLLLPEHSSLHLHIDKLFKANSGSFN